MQMLAQVKLMFLFSFSHAFPFMNSYFFWGSAAGPVSLYGELCCWHHEHGGVTEAGPHCLSVHGLEKTNPVGAHTSVLPLC